MKFKRTLKKEARLLENKRSSFFEDERCRKIMEAFVDKEVELEIQDLTEEEFPIAFVIHEHAEIYEGVESRDEFTRQIIRVINCMKKKSGHIMESYISL